MNGITKFKSTKLLSALLTVLMIVAMLPTTAFAWSVEEGTKCTSTYGDHYVGSDGEMFYSKPTTTAIFYNPNRRWTYEEVKKWLDGEPLVIPGEGIGNVGKGTMPVFKFLGEDFTDPALLFTAFAKNWEEGKKQLFRGVVTAHFRTWNQEIARKCQATEEEAGRENGKDDIIFWKLLYQINPKLKGFYWMGQTYESLPAFGRDVLEKLWDKDKSQYSYYSSILSEKLLSQYVLMAAPKNEKLKKAAEAIEDSYELEPPDARNRGTFSSATCGNTPLQWGAAPVTKALYAKQSYRPRCRKRAVRFCGIRGKPYQQPAF